MNETKYAQMVIGEGIGDNQLEEFTEIFTTDVLPSLKRHQGFDGYQLLHEHGGNMIVLITTWADWDSCVMYHSSRAYRQMVEKTQHLLIGHFVVKLFSEESAFVAVAS